MKDHQVFDTCTYQLSAAQEQFNSLTKKTWAAPLELVSRIKADLASMEQYIPLNDVVIRISDVKFREYNSNTLETVVPNFDAGSNLDFGINIERYHVRTRVGWQIKVNEYALKRYCERFGLYKDFGAEKFSDEVKPKLEREACRRRKPLAEGETPKSRPRVFKDVENAKRLVEKSLLTLKLVEPLAGVEEIAANYTYDS